MVSHKYRKLTFSRNVTHYYCVVEDLNTLNIIMRIVPSKTCLQYLPVILKHSASELLEKIEDMFYR